MASLFERNGTYYSQFYDANQTPKVRRFSLRTKRKKVARKRLVELERDWETGKFDPWIDDPQTYKQKATPKKSLNLSQALEEFLQAKREQGRSEKTLANYESFCGVLIELVGSQRPLRSLSKGDVQRYVHDTSVARASRRTRYRHVRAWLRWCVKKGYVRDAVTENVTPPKKGEKMPKAVRVEDLEAIEEAIRSDYREKQKTGYVKEGELLWMIPLFWFGLYSGLRASEIARLRWKHIDSERDLIQIFEQKNGKQQTVPLTAPARRILEDMEQVAPDAFVFLPPGSDPYQRNIKSFRCNLARKFKRYKNAAGIDRPLTPHGLRHGFCTILAEAGKSAVIIKEAARHADISTSMRYVHMANEHLKAELDDVFG